MWPIQNKTKQMQFMIAWTRLWNKLDLDTSRIVKWNEFTWARSLQGGFNFCLFTFLFLSLNGTFSFTHSVRHCRFELDLCVFCCFARLVIVNLDSGGSAAVVVILIFFQTMDDWKTKFFLLYIQSRVCTRQIRWALLVFNPYHICIHT